MIRRTIKHRKNRQRLPKRTYPAIPLANILTISAATSVATITFDRAVQMNGAPALTVATVTQSSAVQTDDTTIAVTFSGALATHAWQFSGGSSAVLTSGGGSVAAKSGTF